MHPLNPHRTYDFEKLKSVHPEFGQYVFKNQYDTQTIDFSNAKAVKALNKAILAADYDIKNWDIPAGFLCPPVPGRLDYLYYLSDLIPLQHANVLDIGTGANCIYPILGLKTFGWTFVASEINIKAFNNAKHIVKSNNLEKDISLRFQEDPKKIFEGIILKTDLFDLTMCNPPFHDSEQSAHAANQRKTQNLKTEGLNFGGTAAELYTEGGEPFFIKKMIEESKSFGQQCTWFSSLVSKKETIEKMQKVLKRTGVSDYKIIEMRQGQKLSRILAWSFI